LGPHNSVVSILNRMKSVVFYLDYGKEKVIVAAM
jgi:hypothetical protein